MFGETPTSNQDYSSNFNDSGGFAPFLPHFLSNNCKGDNLRTPKQMQPELEMIAPVVFAFVTFLSVWLGVTALDIKPNSGVLIIPHDDASYFAIS